MNRFGSKAIVPLMVATALSAACGSTKLVICSTRDIASLDPDAAKALDPKDSAWIHNARVCDMGEYVVVTPTDSGKKNLIVLHKRPSQGVLFAASDNQTSLFDADRKRGLRGLLVLATPEHIAVFNANGKGANLMVTKETIDLIDPDSERALFSVTHQQSRNSVSWSAYDSTREAWIENVDVGPDGEIDIRNTEVRGQPKKTEFRIGNRWLERAQRNGEQGVLLGGQFMSVTDARSRLGLEPDER